jgi:hypothetical protein
MRTKALRHDPAADRGRSFDADRGKRVFGVIVICLFAGYLARTIAHEPHNWRQFLVIGGMLACASIALSWLAWLSWTKIRFAPVRYTLAIVLAWHALFGPAMMLHRIVTHVSTNQDLAHMLWPHVIHWIDALE